MAKMIRLSDKVYTQLKHYADDSDRSISNAGEYIINRFIQNEVIGSPSKNTPLPEKTEVEKPAVYMQVGGTTPSAEVSDLFKPTNIRPFNQADPMDASNPEQSCCLNENKPCKHWVWDSATGEGYKNILSGRLMEVE